MFSGIIFHVGCPRFLLFFRESSIKCNPFRLATEQILQEHVFTDLKPHLGGGIFSTEGFPLITQKR